MTKRGRWTDWIIALPCALGLTVGAAAAPDAATPRKGGTAIVVVGSEPTMINAVMSVDSSDQLAGCMVYEGLVVMDTTDQALPGLAESWTISDDGRTYSFRLREARFHDGTPFTSEDVRFTLSEVAVKLNPTMVAISKLLDTVETPDPRTAVIRLKQAYAPLLRSLSCALSGGILPAHLYRNTDYRTNPVTTRAPVGTGPFRFSGWTRGDNVAFVRNELYWNPARPYLDSLVIRFMPSAGSRIQALLAGEVDYVSSSQFPVSSAKVVEANRNLKLERTGWSPNMLWAFFNLDRKPLSDVRVRRALLTATDRHYILTNAFAGSGLAATAPWTVRVPWAADPTIDYDKSNPFDPEKAGQMLEEAGYKADANGIRFRLGVNYNGAVPERQQTALALQAFWRRAGVQLVLEPLESAVLVPRVHRDANFDIYISSYNSYGDPAIGMAPAFVSQTIGMNFGNASHYSNPEVDALFDQATRPATLEERGALYRKAEQILMRDLPVITLHENHGRDAATRRLHGAWGAYGFGQWGDAWLEQ